MNNMLQKMYKRRRRIDNAKTAIVTIAAIIFVIFFGLYFYGIDWIALLVRRLAQR